MTAIKLEPVERSELRHYKRWFNEGASDFLMGSSDGLAGVFSAQSNQLAWKMTLGDEVLAIVTITVNQSRIGKLKLAVERNVRRRGVGSAVVREVLKLPKVKELRQLEAEIPASNTGAQKILKKNGFVRVGTSFDGKIKFRLV